LCRKNKLLFLVRGKGELFTPWSGGGRKGKKKKKKGLKVSTFEGKIITQIRHPSLEGRPLYQTPIKKITYYNENAEGR